MSEVETKQDPIEYKEISNDAPAHPEKQPVFLTLKEKEHVKEMIFGVFKKPVFETINWSNIDDWIYKA
jgi:hypothetical protein